MSYPFKGDYTPWGAAASWSYTICASDCVATGPSASPTMRIQVPPERESGSVCIRVSIMQHVYLPACTYVLISTRFCMHVMMCMYVHTCVYVYGYVQEYVHVHVRVYMYPRGHVYGGYIEVSNLPC